MSLSSFFQRFARGQSAGPAATLSAAEIERVRQQAKRRLIGMTVLVVTAVLLLSWLLETQPRQGPQDVRIDMATADSTDAPLVTPVLEPAPRPELTESVQSPSDRSADSRANSSTNTPLYASLADDEEVVIVKPKVAQVSQVAPAKPTPPKVIPPKPEASKTTPPKPIQKVAEKPAEKPTPKARYVVQIGAFSDVTLARQARLKVEKLGFKTYTQVITTAKGRTIRVRVGPYTSETEANHAVASIRLAGMTAGLLTL